MSSTGHQSGSDSESAAVERSTLTTIPHVDLSSSPPNLPDDLIIGHSDSNTASAAAASDSNPNDPNEPSEPHRIVIIDEEFIKVYLFIKYYKISKKICNISNQLGV